MEEARDQDSVGFSPVEDGMTTLLKPNQVGTYPTALPAEGWIVGKHVNTLLQRIEITNRLSWTPGSYCESAYVDKVLPSSSRQTEGCHR